MRLTFLGTGAVDAVPLRGCDCRACANARAFPQHCRAPASARLDLPDRSLMIDAGRGDFGPLIDANPIDALLLTHFHVDHVQGLFPFRWGLAPQLTVYAPDDPAGCADLLRHTGCLEFATLDAFKPIALGRLTVTPVPLHHSRPTLGYVFDDGQTRLAYLTDTAALPEDTRAFLIQHAPETMVLDCTHPPGAGCGNHNTPDEVCAEHRAIQPRRTLMTHVSHSLDAWLMANPAACLPGMAIASDGQVIEPAI